MLGINTIFNEGGLTFFNLLIGLGGFFWLAAYILIIRKGFAENLCAMPIIGLAGNIVWEGIFSPLVWRPEAWQDQWQSYINGAWFCFDLAILTTFLLYGRTRGPLRNRLFKTFGVAAILSSVVMFVALYYMASLDGPDAILRFHRISAFVVGPFMSVGYIFWLFHRGTEAQSMPIAWTKFLGTGIIVVAYSLPFAPNSFGSIQPIIMAAGWTSFMLDLWYVFLLRKAINR